MRFERVIRRSAAKTGRHRAGRTPYTRPAPSAPQAVPAKLRATCKSSTALPAAYSASAAARSAKLIIADAAVGVDEVMAAAMNGVAEGRAAASDPNRAQSEHTRTTEDDSSLEGGVRTPLKQTEQARRTLGSLDDSVNRTSPKCQPQRVVRGVSSGVLSRRCTTPAMRLTTKSASWHAALGSSWRGALRGGFRDHCVGGVAGVDHEGVRRPETSRYGFKLHEVAGGLSRPG